jgi:hypothetical protein
MASSFTGAASSGGSGTGTGTGTGTGSGGSTTTSPPSDTGATENPFTILSWRQTY